MLRVAGALSQRRGRGLWKECAANVVVKARPRVKGVRRGRRSRSTDAMMGFGARLEEV